MAGPTVAGAVTNTEAIGRKIILKGVEWTLPKAAKVATAKGVAAKGTIKGAGMTLQGGTIVGATGQANTLTASAGVATVATKAGSGTIWSGTGINLGWGLGLGSWGPVVLVGVVTAVGVGIHRYLKNRASGGELEETTS